MTGADALDELYWRAEILQAMFWMRGEGLAGEVGPARLAEFLAAEPTIVADQMRRLVADGYLELGDGRWEMGDGEGSSPSPISHLPSPAYRLTPLGVAEGGRSFRDEFAGLTRLAHGECGPACWCKDPDHAGDPCPSETEREPEPARES